VSCDGKVKRFGGSARDAGPLRVVFRSPVVYKEYKGIDAVAFLLSNVIEVFEVS